MEAPAPQAQYKILAKALQACMVNKIIQPRVTIPTYEDAESHHTQNYTDSNGTRLIDLITKIQRLSSESKFNWNISGRTLGDLVTTSLERYGRAKASTLDEVFNYIELYITAKCKRKRDTRESTEYDEEEYDNVLDYTSGNAQKSVTFRWNGEFDEKAFRRYTSTLGAKRRKKMEEEDLETNYEILLKEAKDEIDAEKVELTIQNKEQQSEDEDLDLLEVFDYDAFAL